MKKVLKYNLSIHDELVLNLPKDFQFLSAGIQNNRPVMWVLADEEAGHKNYQFSIVGTGNPIPNIDKLKYLSTFQHPPFVWHLFQFKE